MAAITPHARLSSARQEPAERTWLTQITPKNKMTTNGLPAVEETVPDLADLFVDESDLRTGVKAIAEVIRPDWNVDDVVIEVSTKKYHLSFHSSTNDRSLSFFNCPILTTRHVLHDINFTDQFNMSLGYID